MVWRTFKKLCLMVMAVIVVVLAVLAVKSQVAATVARRIPTRTNDSAFIKNTPISVIGVFFVSISYKSINLLSALLSVFLDGD